MNNTKSIDAPEAAGSGVHLKSEGRNRRAERDLLTLCREPLSMGGEDEAPLGKLLRELLTPNDGTSGPDRLAIGLLLQLSREIEVLHFALERGEDGGAMSSAITHEVLISIATRARAGAELCERLIDANEGGSQ